MVISLFNSSKSADAKTLDRLDVYCGLDRTTEIVSVLVTFLLVHLLHRVSFSCSSWLIVSVRICLVINRIGRVQDSSHLPVCTVVVIAIVHIREVVLKFEPAIERLLRRSDLGKNLLTVIVLRNTLSVLIVK